MLQLIRPNRWRGLTTAGHAMRAQMQGFGQERLLTAGEEKVLSRRIQALIRAQAAQAAAVARLERGITEREWAAECGLASVRELRKTLKVRADCLVRAHSCCVAPSASPALALSRICMLQGEEMHPSNSRASVELMVLCIGLQAQI